MTFGGQPCRGRITGCLPCAPFSRAYRFSRERNDGKLFWTNAAGAERPAILIALALNVSVSFPLLAAGRAQSQPPNATEANSATATADIPACVSLRLFTFPHSSRIGAVSRMVREQEGQPELPI